MIRLLGVNISKKKYLKYGLIKIFGIGIKKSIQICNKFNFNDKKICDLNENEINDLRNFLSTLILENELKKKIYFSIKRKIDLKCYQGIRHIKKLPVHGQRTRTNAHTAKKR